MVENSMMVENDLAVRVGEAVTNEMQEAANTGASLFADMLVAEGVFDPETGEILKEQFFVTCRFRVNDEPGGEIPSTFQFSGECGDVDYSVWRKMLKRVRKHLKRKLKQDGKDETG